MKEETEISSSAEYLFTVSNKSLVNQTIITVCIQVESDLKPFASINQGLKAGSHKIVKGSV